MFKKICAVTAVAAAAVFATAGVASADTEDSSSTNGWVWLMGSGSVESADTAPLWVWW